MKPKAKTLRNNQKGSIIVSILVVSLFLTTVVYALLVLANSNLSRSRGRILLLEAQYAAESGADAAIATLNSGNTSYTGTVSDVTLLTNSTYYKATYSITVAAGVDNKEKIITATGKVYAPTGAASPSFTRKIEAVAQRSSTSTSTSMLSRNIIQIDSSVKDILARDVYVNGYIAMNKNSNNLIAENITVADKNTGATNCSIGGSGSLSKPTSFHTAGQTKTNINIGFNNCISPPGNTTNANFNVNANNGNISKIQSTYIPFSQYMDNTYQNSPGGCNDWTTGASPRSIPSTGNTKKTLYPDSGNNIDPTCGSSGDLSLGSTTYTIRDHVHVRANFCAASACSPTFNNPDATVKYVFIEGTVNFDTLTTSPSSGPIVFIAYGADPASKAGSCPLGGAFYLGNGDTSAPDAYFLAVNGICLDKSKFNVEPALGGVSGKNIYIATNSGTPHDLHLDPLFPVDQIPVDLSWRAVRYRRL